MKSDKGYNAPLSLIIKRKENLISIKSSRFYSNQKNLLLLSLSISKMLDVSSMRNEGRFPSIIIQFNFLFLF